MIRENNAPPLSPTISNRKTTRLNTTISIEAWDILNLLRGSKPKSEFLTELLLRESNFVVPLNMMQVELIEVRKILSDRLGDPERLHNLLREISDQRVGFDKLLEALMSVNDGMQKMKLGSQNFVAQHERMIADLQKFANSYESTFSEWIGQIEKRMSVAGKVQAHLTELGEATNQLTKSLKKRELSAEKSKQNLEKLFSDLEEYRSLFGSSVSETLRVENEKHAKKQKWFNSVLLLITATNMAGLGFLVWRSLT